MVGESVVGLHTGAMCAGHGDGPPPPPTVPPCKPDLRTQAGVVAARLAWCQRAGRGDHCASDLARSFRPKSKKFAQSDPAGGKPAGGASSPSPPLQQFSLPAYSAPASLSPAGHPCKPRNKMTTAAPPLEAWLREAALLLFSYGLSRVPRWFAALVCWVLERAGVFCKLGPLSWTSAPRKYVALVLTDAPGTIATPRLLQVCGFGRIRAVPPTRHVPASHRTGQIGDPPPPPPSRCCPSTAPGPRSHARCLRSPSATPWGRAAATWSLGGTCCAPPSVTGTSSPPRPGALGHAWGHVWLPGAAECCANLPERARGWPDLLRGGRVLSRCGSHQLGAWVSSPL